jgi:hypothetical protein
LAEPIAETDLLGRRRTPLRIGRRGDPVIGGQFPAAAIDGDFEIMDDPQMPAEHLGVIPAFEANDVIPLYGTPNRNRWRQRFWHW